MFVYILSLKSPSFIHHQSVSSVWAHETHLCLHNVLAFKFSPSFSSCFVFFHFLIFIQINIRYTYMNIWKNVQIQKTEIFFLFAHLNKTSYIVRWAFLLLTNDFKFFFIKGSLCLAFHHNALLPDSQKSIRF